MSLPWNEGGKSECLDHAGLTMTHDELAEKLGDAYRQIIEAGFVIVPRSWRDAALEQANKKVAK